MQRLWRGSAHWEYQPRVAPTKMYWTLLHQSLMKKMLYSCMLWSHFLNCSSFLSDDMCLGLLDIKQASTDSKWNQPKEYSNEYHSWTWAIEDFGGIKLSQQFLCNVKFLKMFTNILLLFRSLIINMNSKLTHIPCSGWSMTAVNDHFLWCVMQFTGETNYSYRCD